MATPAQPTSTEVNLTVTPTAPVQGIKTSEAWLSALTVFLGALPAMVKILFGVDISPIVQGIGIAISGLTSMHYTAARTSLKRAHVTASWNGAVAAAKSRTLPALAGSAAVLLAIGFVTSSSCGGAQPTLGQVGTAAGSAAIDGLDCEGVNLEGLVGFGPDANLTLAEEFAKDIASANYAGAVADFLQTFGTITGGCAALALKDFENGLAGLGSVSTGSASTSALAIDAAQRAAILSRLDELQKQYGWKRAPKTAKRMSALKSSATNPSNARPHRSVPRLTAAGEDRR